MKTAVAVSGAVAIVSAIVLLLMPSERYDGLREAWQRLSATDAIECLDYERERLKDPDSARLLTSWVDAKEKDLIHIRYKAKNSYGAYNTTEAICVPGIMAKDESRRSLSRMSTDISRENVRIEIEHEEVVHQSKCTDLAHEAMVTGKSLREARIEATRDDPWCADHMPQWRRDGF